ncbi:diaminobutyrate acetyltransferase [Candidatus Nitrosopumilus sediminis]|uniref:L-2,4-diaminobutyric acid acetyltransferase n=1 Tax=Candidatus Nitrosopumilus sediminis TaxID=1229909 RepID=K0B9P0_9ARCH|nr:diaminobutyrate acetyltransferase [Candidatus Nitrosopumilus sediminis]AFS82209.1 L-2,4-diaminobutyric acid acetyltransferase [Candidatus Nitrosopumilus sediminis]
MSSIIFREPLVSDADSIWNLVNSNKPLDENSKYLYVLLCHQFSKTCVVAESDSKIIGFLSGFISPKNPDTLFVWQAAVDDEFRNKGIAKELVLKALSQTDPTVQFVEATVTPSNKASLKFLQNFASQLDADFTKSPLFSTEILGHNHEPEDLIRIGPIQKSLLEVTA